MVITITSIKLRKLWYYLILSYFGLKVQRKIKTNDGFLKMKNTGFGYWHYTLTAWKSETGMKNFARSGKHLEAIKSSKKLATEVRVYMFRGEQIPNWKEAKNLLFENGKIVSFE